METENIYRQELISKYRQSLGQIFRYLPWLKEKSGNDMTKHYQGADMPKKSIVIPVYDIAWLCERNECYRADGPELRLYIF